MPTTNRGAVFPLVSEQGLLSGIDRAAAVNAPDAPAAAPGTIRPVMLAGRVTGPAGMVAADGTRWGLGPLAVDAAGLALAAITAAALQALAASRTAAVPASHLFLQNLGQVAGVLPVLLVVLAGTRRSADTQFATGPVREMHAVCGPLAAGGLGALCLWRLAETAGMGQPGLDVVLLTCVVAVVSVAATRLAYRAPTRRRCPQRVVIVGSGTVAARVEQRLRAGGQVEVLGFVDDDPPGPDRCLGRVADLPGLCDRLRVDHVVVAFTRVDTDDLLDAIRPLQGRLAITVVPRLFDVLPANATVRDLGAGFPAISMGPSALGVMPRVVKRTMDVAVAGLVLAVLSPLMLAVAVAIRLTSRGPAILRQERVGRDGQRFTMCKFRSMYVRSPTVVPAGEAVAGPFPKLKRDPRVTPVGRCIRRTSIDELPQLFNVLKGDMALVGPRPFIPDDAAWIDGWALRRYSVRPGITGLWQVSGRNDLSFEEMCRLDHLYVSCWSVGLDVSILARTLRAVVGAHGAY